VIIEAGAVAEGGGRDGQAADRPDGRLPHQVGLFRPVLRPGGLARRLVGRPRGGDVGREDAQLGVGPCDQRLACPRVEFVFGQPVPPM
jgi:hypothetical protein